MLWDIQFCQAQMEIKISRRNEIRPEMKWTESEPFLGVRIYVRTLLTTHAYVHTQEGVNKNIVM